MCPACTAALAKATPISTSGCVHRELGKRLGKLAIELAENAERDQLPQRRAGRHRVVRYVTRRLEIHERPPSSARESACIRSAGGFSKKTPRLRPGRMPLMKR